MAAEVAGSYAIVRVPECAEPIISAVLDRRERRADPAGTKRRTGRLVVSAARYAPEGTRGVNPWTRAARYGATADWTAVSNRDVGVMVLIEGAEGIQISIRFWPCRESTQSFSGLSIWRIRWGWASRTSSGDRCD